MSWHFCLLILRRQHELPVKYLHNNITLYYCILLYIRTGTFGDFPPVPEDSSESQELVFDFRGDFFVKFTTLPEILSESEELLLDCWVFLTAATVSFSDSFACKIFTELYTLRTNVYYYIYATVTFGDFPPLPDDSSESQELVVHFRGSIQFHKAEWIGLDWVRTKIWMD